MFLTTRGLVLREVRYKESDRILTVLTEGQGKLTVKARGALRKGSRLGGASQALCYSELTLFGNRGRWTADEGVTVEQFLGLREDISQLALGTYFAEVLETVCAEEVPDPAALQLALNSLYALSRGVYGPEHIKSVFELRLMCLEGFEPSVEACGVCGREDVQNPMLSLSSGTVHCRDCGSMTEGASVPVDGEALAAMRHIAKAPAKRVFSFVIPEESEERLGRASEAFLRQQLDRSFSSLDYWKKVR